MASQIKRGLFNFGVLAAFVLGFGVYLTVSGKWDTLFEHLAGMNKLWLTAGILCMIAYLALEVLSLHVTLKLSNIRISVKRLVSTSMVGQFFGNITPMASGAQPAQVTALGAAGVSVGASASALLSKFIVYQATLTLYAAFMLFSEYEFFKQSYGNVTLLAFVGFAIHVMVLAGLLLAAISPRALKTVSYLFINVGARLKLVKDVGGKRRAVREEIAQFSSASRQLRHHKRQLFQISLITVVQLTVFYLVPYCVMRGLDVRPNSMFLTIAAAAFVLLIASAVPLPGGSGGAEGSFAVFFGLFLTGEDGLVVVALILWRLITFYLPTLLGAPFVSALKKSERKAAVYAPVSPVPKIDVKK